MISKISAILLLTSSFCMPAESGEPAKILLSFDDGPNEATTTVVLNEMAKRNAKAIFFVLTGPETLLGNVYPKAETESGFQTVVREIRDGHMIACHWGGTYISQLRKHPKRLLAPAYDSTGDGVIDKISESGNALESDLIQCQDRLNQALVTVQNLAVNDSIQKPGTINYIRPPVWKYIIGNLDARSVYSALGMQMIMTDYRLVDGGYWFQSFAQDSVGMIANTVKAIASGETEVVLTMHDSNTSTVRELPAILDRLEKSLRVHGLKRGVDWDYTQNIKEIDNTLQNFLRRGPL